MAAVKIDEQKCTGCKICIRNCPEPGVIQMKQNKKVAINQVRCKACYLCVSACPKKALSKEGESC